MHTEGDIYKKELEEAGYSPEEIESRIKDFIKSRNSNIITSAQRSYIESFLTLLNCDPDGKLKAKNIVDYYRKPEYIYLGPDENMHNEMIEWIANYSKY